VRWWRLLHPVTIRDLDKVLMLGRGVELEDEETILVKQGISLLGRALHHWYIYLRFKRNEDDSITITHWYVDEEHFDSIHFHTPVVEMMFGEVKPFKTSWYEKREIAQRAANYLKELDELKKVKTKFGEIWEHHYRQVIDWLKRGYKVYYYKCEKCKREAFTIIHKEKIMCSGCKGIVTPIEVTLKDLEEVEVDVQVNVLDTRKNSDQRRQDTADRRSEIKTPT